MSEQIVQHVRWTVDTNHVVFRCLNCGVRTEYDVVRLANLDDPQRLLYEFTHAHKDCKYEPR